MSPATIRRLGLALLGAAGTLFLVTVLSQTPFVRERLGWRISELRSRVQYALSPPDQAIFTPDLTLSAAVAATLSAYTPSPTATLQAGPSPTSTATPPPSATPAPIPDSMDLEGVVYVDQHNRWNYCGPANLTMALNYWGWAGDRDDVARIVKPGVQDPDLDFIQRGRWDKNVMPYELADFVAEQTEYSVLVRSGGEIEVLKRLIAAGFPVLVEKGYYEADYTGKVAWLGHYLFTTGYDDSAGELIVQDAYLEPGRDLAVPYQDYIDGWRSFNYLFLVVYPPDREDLVYQTLGPWADPAWADEHALAIAQEEGAALDGINEFFAWFNQGSSMVNQLRYAEAATAYDTAFNLYARLEDDETQRPYRIMWYQTGPYWAYFYAGRYQDVINLANTTLEETISEPTLEESLYWRGLAKEALGDRQGALADLLEAVRLNPNFSAGRFQLNRILSS